MSSNIPINLTNYLVPAVGNIAGISQQAILSTGIETPVDFVDASLNGAPFVPQSVYVDNSLGLDPLTIYSQKLQFICAIVQAGAVVSVNFPSVADDNYILSGAGSVSLVWSNAPALGNGETTATISGTPAVTISGTPTVALSGTTPINIGVTSVFQAVYGHIIGGGTSTGNLTPGTPGNLRLVEIVCSANANIAAPGNNGLTVSLDNNPIYIENMFFPVTNRTVIELDFSVIAPNSVNGSLNVSLATALSAGFIDVNGYFD